jgi:hypothetical protein
MIRNAITAAAALALTASPIAAQAAPDISRAGSEVSQSEKLRGTTQWIIAAVVLGLLIWGGIELLGDDSPDSP